VLRPKGRLQNAGFDGARHIQYKRASGRTALW
jgi:hypothetical protein